MCMFLYGGINEEVNRNDYEKQEKSVYHFKLGSTATIERDLNAHNYAYTITQGHCDCDTLIGQGDANHPEIKALAEYIKSLQDMRNIKWACIAKKWWDEDIEERQTVHINDIDILGFLANIKEKCLYKIQLFRKEH